MTRLPLYRIRYKVYGDENIYSEEYSSPPLEMLWYYSRFFNEFEEFHYETLSNQMDLNEREGNGT